MAAADALAEESAAPAVASAAPASSAAMLQFPLTVASAASADDTEGLRDDRLHDDYEPVLELQRIEQCVALTEEACAQLAAAVHDAQAAGCASDLRSLGSFLRSRHGYLVSLRSANASKQPKAYLRQLRHEFLVVRGLPGLGGGEEVLVDLGLREHFFLSPHLATPWYLKLLEAVPSTWVGPASALVPVVGLMAAGMRLCFRQAGVPLPPWREARACLSMWLPEVASDEQLPVVPLPDLQLRRLLAPFHAPFRTAVREAAEEAAGSGGGSGGGIRAAPATAPAHQQWATGGGGSSSRHHTSLPPLPRQQQQQHAGIGARGGDPKQQQQQHAHRPPTTSCVPDVPRKIVVGFPMASLPLRDQQLSGGGSPPAPAPGAQQQQQQQQPSEQQQQQDQSGRSSQAPPQPAGAPSTLVDGAQQTGAPLQQAHRQQHHHKQQQQPASHARAPAAAGAPAFTSTAGVVVATAGGRSPGMVINKAWLQQQLAGPGSPAAALQGTSADHVPAAAGSPAVHAAEGSAGSAGSAGGKAGVLGGGGGAAAGGGGGKRQQFKTLDQLLPRMRTVRLGAA